MQGCKERMDAIPVREGFGHPRLQDFQGSTCIWQESEEQVSEKARAFGRAFSFGNVRIAALEARKSERRLFTRATYPNLTVPPGRGLLIGL